MLGRWRKATLEDFTVLGCFLFCFFMGIGLLGVTMVAIRRFRGAPHSGEGTILASSMVCIALAFAVPMARSIAERIYKD